MSEFNITPVSHVVGETIRSESIHGTTEKQGSYDQPYAIDKKLADGLNSADPPIANPKSKDGKWHDGDKIFVSPRGEAAMISVMLSDSVEVKQGKSGPQVIMGH